MGSIKLSGQQQTLSSTESLIHGQFWNGSKHISGHGCSVYQIKQRTELTLFALQLAVPHFHVQFEVFVTKFVADHPLHKSGLVIERDEYVWPWADQQVCTTHVHGIGVPQEFRVQPFLDWQVVCVVSELHDEKVVLDNQLQKEDSAWQAVCVV